MGSIIDVNNINIWYEEFGDQERNNPTNYGSKRKLYAVG